MDPQKALKGCRAGELQVLLAHQPNAAKRVIREGLATHVDLILSGEPIVKLIKKYFKLIIFENNINK